MSDIDEGCFEAVRSHLQQAFPDWRLDERWDSARATHTFRLTKHREPVHLLKVSREVLGDNRPNDLAAILKHQQVAQALRQADKHRLLLCSRGVEAI